jgi:hypothetical protein
MYSPNLEAMGPPRRTESELSPNLAGNSTVLSRISKHRFPNIEGERQLAGVSNSAGVLPELPMEKPDAKAAVSTGDRNGDLRARTK